MISRLEELKANVDQLKTLLKQLKENKVNEGTKTVEMVMSQARQKAVGEEEIFTIKEKLTDIKESVENLILKTEECSKNVEDLSSEVKNRKAEVEVKKKSSIFYRFRKLIKHNKKKTSSG